MTPKSIKCSNHNTLSFNLLLRKSMAHKCSYYRPQRSCGQGNIFTPVCHSVHRGEGGLPQCMLGYHPPLDQPDPPLGSDTTSPWTRWTPPDQTPPSPDQADHPPPRIRHTPPDQTRPPPGPDRHPPGKQTPAYGLRAAGTHPTGMHSCCKGKNRKLLADTNVVYQKWPL